MGSSRFGSKSIREPNQFQKQDPMDIKRICENLRQSAVNNLPPNPSYAEYPNCTT